MDVLNILSPYVSHVTSTEQCDLRVLSMTKWLGFLISEQIGTRQLYCFCSTSFEAYVCNFAISKCIYKISGIVNVPTNSYGDI